MFIPYDYRNVCRDAAQYIEDHGWCQHHWRWGEQACIEGAIRAVARDSFSAVRASSEVRGALRLSRRSDAITAWNDAPERTRDDVIAVLRQVAFV